MTQGTQEHGQYEFNSAENAVIGRTGGWVNAWGIIQMILGGFAAIGAAITIVVGLAATSRGPLIGGMSYLLYAAFLLFLGVNFTRAAGAFKRVVSSQGNDIPLMMQALESLRKAFKAQVIFMIVAAVIGLMAGLAAAGAAAIAR
jgi:hypothetical protein